MVLIIEISKGGNILATENQQAIINDVIEVKTGVYSHKTLTKTVKSSDEHAERVSFHVADAGYPAKRCCKWPLLRKLCRNGACEELRLCKVQGEYQLFS